MTWPTKIVVESLFLIQINYEKEIYNIVCLS